MCDDTFAHKRTHNHTRHLVTDNCTHTLSDIKERTFTPFGGQY